MKKINKKPKNNKIIKNLKKFTSKINLTKNKFNTIELILIFIMALVFGLLIGEMIFSSGKETISITKKTNKNMTEIENVYNTISEEYINEVNEEKLKDAAIEGMMSTLGDQHSVYYNEKDSENFKDELNGYFYGIGAGVYQEKGKLVTIKEIYKNSPAEKAGLKAGDQYIKINGEDITKLTAEQISNKIKGKQGKELTLTIKRKNQEKNIKITTGKVEIPSVNKEKDNITQLIIDLRYNQGGHLDTVINVASEFLTKKNPIIQIVTKNKTNTKYSVKDSKNKYKIEVLINEGSASASEVLAAALNEQLGAELIGTTTYGKGTVQKTKTMPSGGVIKYTIETWKTSKGKDIDGRGIKTTIEIEQNEKYYKTYKNIDDKQLQKAIETIIK